MDLDSLVSLDEKRDVKAGRMVISIEQVIPSEQSPKIIWFKSFRKPDYERMIFGYLNELNERDCIYTKITELIPYIDSTMNLECYIVKAEAVPIEEFFGEDFLL